VILLLDNYDSFTYNLAQYLGELGCQVEVHRNDRISVEQIARRKPERIVISPGPCTPQEAGISVELIQKLGGKIQEMYFAFGEYDAIVITEMPDNVSAAAIALAFASGGALRTCQTTALMTRAEALDAMRKAGQCGYKPMTASATAAR